MAFRNMFRIKAMSKGEALQEVKSSLAAEPMHKAREFIERRLQVPIYKFKDYDSYVKAGYGKVWATFRACHITAAAFITTVFKVHNEGESRRGAPPIEELGEFGKLMTTPNPYETWEEVLYQWVFHMKLTGNAYWLKDSPTMVTRKPLALYPLLPQYIEIVPDATKKVKEYKYKVNGKVVVFQPEDIIHFKRPHPSDVHMGLGDIEGGIDLYQDYINRNALQEKFIENGAMPSGILSREDAEEVDETEWARLKAWWNKEYTGTKNSGKTAFLSGKWKYQKLGLSHQEMQDIENTKYTIDQIFINHGVPLSVAGIRDATNYATARAEDANFRKYEIVPLLDLFCGRVNMEGSLIKLFNQQWKLSYELSGLIDVEQIWKDYGSLFLNGGLTPNELRGLMGLAKSDNPLLDLNYLPLGRVPIEMAGLADQGNDPNAPAKEEPPEPAMGNGPGQRNDPNRAK